MCYIIYIILFIILIICLIQIFHLYKYDNNIIEPFNVNKINDKSECNYLQMNDCLKSNNCGYMTTNNFINICVPGDKNGPYNINNSNKQKYLDKTEYYKWYFNDDYSRAVIANDDKYRNMNIPIFE